MPNLDALAPGNDETDPAVTLNLGINRRDRPTPGLGYGPGSRFRLDDDRRPIAVPGVLLHVPLR